MNATLALLVHPDDDVLVALRDLPAGAQVGVESVVTTERIVAKHKLARRDLEAGAVVRMYGVEVGRATCPIPRGGLVSRSNLAHSAAPVTQRSPRASWRAPEVGHWRDVEFQGYLRPCGRVGTANYWLVLPLVFCENQKLLLLREALQDALGFGRAAALRHRARALTQAALRGEALPALSPDELSFGAESPMLERPFPNVDGVRFLMHHMGCGGTPSDTQALCALLAAYVDHPNVAGATVLSLGCQHAQVKLFEDTLHRINPRFSKPVHVVESQRHGGENAALDLALRRTLEGVAQSNALTRAPAPLSSLALGVKCGASDGFSGISANPALGLVSDMLVALGGKVVLGEFPELCGVEQELVDRAADDATADRFLALMRTYDERLAREGAGFDMNPSPGNVRDGLITDAMKSAGAARKGGTSPIVETLDYPEVMRQSGLHLMCTPGHDVESVTALAGAGATLVLFTTGLGTAVGNAVAPVIKVSSNSELPRRMPDVIDVDAGGVLSGEVSLAEMGEKILRVCVEVASGRRKTCADKLGQEDFMPWKRGMSL